MSLRDYDRRTYIADAARAFTQHRIGKREFLRRMTLAGVGLSGFYVQFFYGLIIILSLLGHRWNQARYR